MLCSKHILMLISSSSIKLRVLKNKENVKVKRCVPRLSYDKFYEIKVKVSFDLIIIRPE